MLSRTPRQPIRTIRKTDIASGRARSRRIVRHWRLIEREKMAKTTLLAGTLACVALAALVSGRFMAQDAKATGKYRMEESVAIREGRVPIADSAIPKLAPVSVTMMEDDTPYVRTIREDWIERESRYMPDGTFPSARKQKKDDKWLEREIRLAEHKNISALAPKKGALPLADLDIYAPEQDREKEAMIWEKKEAELMRLFPHETALQAKSKTSSRRSVAALPTQKGTPRWRKNAFPAIVPVDRPMIAVVIDDLGIDRRRTDKILSLPGPLTASFLSYARYLDAQLAKADKSGHERLLHVPMQPKSARFDPGPGALTTDMLPHEIRARLLEFLADNPGIVGINNHMGSLFTADADAMKPVMSVLKETGHIFLDSQTTNHSTGPALALKTGVPYAVRHVFLDNFPGEKTALRQLKKLEKIARRTGFAVGIGHPRDGTITALGRWLPTLEEKGFSLVPVSSVVKVPSTKIATKQPARTAAKTARR